MIETFKEIWKFSGKEQKNVIKSVINNFLNAVFYMLQIGSIFFAIDGMLKKKAGKETIFLCFGMIVPELSEESLPIHFPSFNRHMLDTLRQQTREWQSEKK